MLIEIKEVVDANEKSAICNDILRALPDWFGIETSIVGYVEAVRAMPFYVVTDHGKAVGFVALKVHNPFTLDVYVIGILKEYHRYGIGKMLIECCEKYGREQGMEYLTVKTLDASAKLKESEGYEKTRMFYQAVGFKPLEVFPLLWAEGVPCLMMVKNI